jgi:polysaccharide export outer membrane protein
VRHIALVRSSLALLVAFAGCGVAVDEAPESLEEANKLLEPVSAPKLFDMKPYLDPVMPEYRIGPGDRIGVDVAGYADLSREELLVRSDGRVTLFVVGDVDVAGLTPRDAAAHVAEKLAPMIERPQVTVTLQESRSQRFLVLGAVSNPGVYELPGPFTVLEALAMAGGLQFDEDGRPLADIGRAYLMRDSTLVPVRFEKLLVGDRTQNVYVRPGDLLFVPPAFAGEVFVLGQVGSPTVIPYKGRVTLMEALARAGWVTEDALESAVRVIRGSLLEPRVYVIDAEDIGAGQRPDVLLAPGDIVFVTTTEIADYNAIIEAILPTLQAAVSARYLIDGVSGIFINDAP